MSRVLAGEHTHTLLHQVGTTATNTEKMWQTPATQGAGHGTM
jgi:hypothetical protein